METKKNWSSFDRGQFVEVLPNNDIKEHYLGDECWCNTTIEYIRGKALITHNSMDGREDNERIHHGHTTIST